MILDFVDSYLEKRLTYNQTMSIIIFLLVLAVLILVHELGHFLVAKKFGVRVDEFGLGFPPKIFAKQWGSTLYTLNALPFGGFVKIFGENPHETEITEEEKSTSFYYKPKWVQALVLVAGVTFNIVFAWILISLGFIIGLPSPVEHSNLGKVSDVHLVITEVMPSSPADKAGLKSGDIITFVSSGFIALDSEELSPDNVRHMISESKTEKIKLSYSRGETKSEVLIEPMVDKDTDKKIIGIGMDSLGILKLPIHLAIIEGFRTTYLLTKNTAIGLGVFVFDAFRFKSDFSQVTGPVGIANIVGDASSLGFVYLISLVAIISINLAVINLIPIPALDGGRLLFVLIESVISRNISTTFIRRASIVSFIFLIILTIVVTTHDILNLF